MNAQFCKFKVTGKRLAFVAADCGAIIDELCTIEWRGVFTTKNVDRSVDLFYDVMWPCFKRTSSHKINLSTFCQEISVGYEGLIGLKNKITESDKKSIKPEEFCQIRRS
jgi:hypothetical protein